MGRYQSCQWPATRGVRCVPRCALLPRRTSAPSERRWHDCDRLTSCFNPLPVYPRPQQLQHLVVLAYPRPLPPALTPATPFLSSTPVGTIAPIITTTTARTVSLVDVCSAWEWLDTTQSAEVTDSNVRKVYRCDAEHHTITVSRMHSSVTSPHPTTIPTSAPPPTPTPTSTISFHSELPLRNALTGVERASRSLVSPPPHGCRVFVSVA